MTYEKSLFVRNYNLNAEFQPYRFVLDVKFVINKAFWGALVNFIKCTVTQIKLLKHLQQVATNRL